MKNWLRKVSVIFIAIMTLGLYVPPVNLYTDAEENNETFSSKSNVDQESFTQVSDVVEAIDLSHTEGSTKEITDDDYFIHRLTEKAKEQTLTKLGPRIIKQVEDEFMEYILPSIEEVLQTTLIQADDDLPYYSITEQPTSGFGERIFHIYDNRTEKDVIMFHVRRDNRPLEGYWFNFHYHLSDDNFEKHHEIGEIYWDKNIPPQWMS